MEKLKGLKLVKIVEYINVGIDPFHEKGMNQIKIIVEGWKIYRDKEGIEKLYKESIYTIDEGQLDARGNEVIHVEVICPITRITISMYDYYINSKNEKIIL